MDDQAALVSRFAIAANELSNTTKMAPFGGALYRCVILQCVPGYLVKFKDSSGYFGAIMNETGIASQAR